MIDLKRTFVVAKPVAVVVAYLKDFAHAQAWDPGTKSCVQESPGPVQVGTTWRNVSEIKGRETELMYRLETFEAQHLRFVGENKTATSIDDMSFTPVGQETSITYHSEITFHGIAKLAGPFLKSEFEELGDKTVVQMTQVLNGL